MLAFVFLTKAIFTWISLSLPSSLLFLSHSMFFFPMILTFELGYSTRVQMREWSTLWVGLAFCHDDILHHKMHLQHCKKTHSLIMNKATFMIPIKNEVEYALLSHFPLLSFWFLRRIFSCHSFGTFWTL